MKNARQMVMSLLAHNEDWVPEDENDVFVVSARPNEEPPFLAMTYGGLLPNVGFNAYGIAQLINLVYPNDSRIGIPRLVVARAVLAARRVSGAIGRMLISHRAAGYNHLLAHESGELYSVEVSAAQIRHPAWDRWVYGPYQSLFFPDHERDRKRS